MSIRQSQFILAVGRAVGVLDRCNIVQYCYPGYADLIMEKMDDEDFVVAYHIEKQKPKKIRSQYSRSYYEKLPNGLVVENKQRKVPIFDHECRTEWLITYYAFPKRNVLHFTQHGNHFDINLISDEAIAYQARRDRGYPEDNDGWFDIKHLEAAAHAISQLAYIFHSNTPHAVRARAGMLLSSDFFMHIDVSSNRFCFKDKAGNKLIGEALKSIIVF